ncbi:protein serrate-like [Ruditapes philippinarum]|uniref:protein serrate-like n=1 Tax=Ruditapes philippinarum TaxID=129788 RepID=UPI00295C31EB|nr:protein serrate-like [Ruditapes philippinarum]
MAEIIRHLPVATGFYLHTDGAYNISEAEIIMSGAMFFNYSYFPDDQRVTLNRSNVVRVGVNWRPHIPDQIGSQQYCVWGVDMFGITTDPRCVTSLVGDDDDHCATGAVSCENNGKCINIFKVPEEKCKCTPGYKSKNCSQVVRCVDNPCENNGTCTDEPNGFKCDCKSDYTGIMCQSKVQPCGSNPCRNGGICLDMQNAFMCLCASTYAGEMCEHFQPKQSENAADDTFLSWILPITIASTAAVALVTGSCLFLTGVYKKTPKNKTQVKPNDHEVYRVSMSEITPVEEW